MDKVARDVVFFNVLFDILSFIVITVFSVFLRN